MFLGFGLKPCFYKLLHRHAAQRRVVSASRKKTNRRICEYLRILAYDGPRHPVCCGTAPAPLPFAAQKHKRCCAAEPAGAERPRRCAPCRPGPRPRGTLRTSGSTGNGLSLSQLHGLSQSFGLFNADLRVVKLLKAFCNRCDIHYCIASRSLFCTCCHYIPS